MLSRSLVSMTLCSLVSMGTTYAADEAASDYWVRVMPAAWMVNFDGSTNYNINGAGSGDHGDNHGSYDRHYRCLRGDVVDARVACHVEAEL